jgi:hypothetical protein
VTVANSWFSALLVGPALTTTDSTLFALVELLDELDDDDDDPHFDDATWPASMTLMRRSRYTELSFIG